MALPTAMGMDYESIQKLNNVRPYEFETDRERKWYEIGLIDGAEAADIKNAYIETKIKNAFKMTFRVHTPNLFKEMWECSGMRIYAKVIRIYLALVNDVAQRATEINDPVLNALMLKLRLYDVEKESDIPKLIDKMKEEYEQSKPIKQNE